MEPNCDNPNCNNPNCNSCMQNYDDTDFDSEFDGPNSREISRNMPNSNYYQNNQPQQQPPYPPYRNPRQPFGRPPQSMYNQPNNYQKRQFGPNSDQYNRPCMTRNQPCGPNMRPNIPPCGPNSCNQPCGPNPNIPCNQPCGPNPNMPCGPNPGPPCDQPCPPNFDNCISDEYLLDYLLRKYGLDKQKLIYSVQKSRERKFKNQIICNFYEDNDDIINKPFKEQYRLFKQWNDGGAYISREDFEYYYDKYIKCSN